MRIDARNVGWLLVLGAGLIGVFLVEGWIDRGLFAPPAEPAVAIDCGEAGVCSYRDADTRLRLELGPQRRVMQPMGILVSIQPVPDPAPQALVMAWRMAGMDMGRQQASLQPLGAGRWQGEITLPVCASGDTDWIGRLDWGGGQPLDFAVTLAP